MRIDIATLFPEMCEAVLGESIIGRARRDKKIEINCYNIRDFANNKHNNVDDTPYGGGCGMVMQAPPIAGCLDFIKEKSMLATGEKPYIVFMTAAGNRYNQNKCKQLALKKSIILVCGHYEGIDQRVIDEYADEEISIGDYVITGGEMAAVIIADSVARLQQGVLASQQGFEEESHYNGLLEYPQYTRPEVWRGREVPQVLLSGHHKNIEKWRNEQSLLRTMQRRPDLYDEYIKATAEDTVILRNK